MVSKLSQLAELLEEESLPSWLKIEIQQRQDEILRTLRENGSGTFVFAAPSGETVTVELTAEKPAEIAA